MWLFVLGCLVPYRNTSAGLKFCTNLKLFAKVFQQNVWHTIRFHSLACWKFYPVKILKWSHVRKFRIAKIDCYMVLTCAGLHCTNMCWPALHWPVLACIDWPVPACICPDLCSLHWPVQPSWYWSVQPTLHWPVLSCIVLTCANLHCSNLWQPALHWPVATCIALTCASLHCTDLCRPALHWPLLFWHAYGLFYLVFCKKNK